MTEQQVSISVSYERKLSDGNYGSEGLSMMIMCPVDEPDGSAADLHALAQELRDLAQELRDLVLSELADSPSPRVARVAAEELNPRPRVAAGSNSDNDSEDPEDLPF
jgi:hypothetical protein